MRIPSGVPNFMSEAIQSARELLTKAGYPERLAFRVLPDGRIAWIHQLMFTHAICVSSPEAITVGYEDRWCFTEKHIAEHALANWEGTEPEGWIRNPRTGRRRPDGDKSREYVSF